MVEWTPEASEYLEGYLRQVGALARQQGEDAEDIKAGLREHITMKLEESGGLVVALDDLRRVLATVGTPEQVIASDFAAPKSSGRTRPIPPPVPPIIIQAAPSRGKPDASSRALRWVIVIAILIPICFVVLSVLGIGTAILLPAFARSREAAQRASCQNNLKQLGIGLKNYADEHQQAFPDDLAALYPQYISDLSVFVCPSTGPMPVDPSKINAWTGYDYTPPTSKVAPSQTVVCRDKKSNHIPGGRNYLYADGHVEFKKVTETATPERAP